MAQLQSFHEDCVALLADKVAQRAIDRRTLLRLGAALGVGATLPAAPSRAAAQGARQIVFVN